MIYVLISICRRLTMVCQDVTSSSQGGRSKALGVFLQCIPDQTTLPVWVAMWRWCQLYMSSVVHITERMVNLLPLCTLSRACDFVVCSPLCAWCRLVGTAVVTYVINSLMSFIFPGTGVCQLMLLLHLSTNWTPKRAILKVIIVWCLWLMSIDLELSYDN